MMNEEPAGMAREVPFDIVDAVSVPTVSTLKKELAQAQHIVEAVGERLLGDRIYLDDATKITARLMAASAQAASAIAKIVDAETRQVLAAERIRCGYFPPRVRTEPRRRDIEDEGA